MVLSNKKLKQKLREAVTESLTSSDQSKPESNPTRDSIKALLEPAIIKSKLRRREKRKETLVSKTLAYKSKTLDLENDKDEKKEGLSEKVKKKRKRECVEVGDEIVGVKNSNIKKKKIKKKKKKKNKKSEKKEEVSVKNENGNVENSENRVIRELGTLKIEADCTGNGQDNGEAAMKVYVGGIPYYSSEDDIRSFFDSCGTITEIDCMMFPESGKFRGIAIISFKTDAAAARALALDGSDMGGLFLKVVPYKPTKAKKYTEDFAPSILEGYNRIYVGNLSWNITEEGLKSFFSGCSISSIRFGEDKETKEFRGYAHVDFTDSVSLNKALKLDQEILCGRPVRVRCAVPPKNKLLVENTPKVNGTSEVVADIGNTVCARPVTVEYAVPPKKNLIVENTTKVSEASEVIADSGYVDVAVVNAVVEQVSGKIRRRTCYECGEKGHLSSSCPKKKAVDQANGVET